MANDSVLVNGVFPEFANNLETVFTAEKDTLIKAVTASNSSNANAAYTMNIVNADDDISNPEIPYRIVTRLNSDTGAEVVNQVVPAGGSIRVSTTALKSIAFRISGRVLE